MFNESAVVSKVTVVGNLKAETAELDVMVVVFAAKIDEPMALIVSLIARLIVKRGKVGAIVTLVPSVCAARVVPCMLYHREQ